jgi:hypothetical protein
MRSDEVMGEEILGNVFFACIEEVKMWRWLKVESENYLQNFNLKQNKFFGGKE